MRYAASHPLSFAPDSGRTGAPDLWERFDPAVAAVNRADAGTSLAAVADAADALADSAEAIATDIKRQRDDQPTPNAATG